MLNHLVGHKLTTLRMVVIISAMCMHNNEQDNDIHDLGDWNKFAWCVLAGLGQ